MLYGNAYNPAVNAPYCSYYDFSCVFFAILLSFLYSLFLWRVFTSYAGSRLTFTFICLLSAFLYQPHTSRLLQHLFRIYVKWSRALRGDHLLPTIETKLRRTIFCINIFYWFLLFIDSSLNVSLARNIIWRITYYAKLFLSWFS